MRVTATRHRQRTYKPNSEAFSPNPCYHGKVIRITYSECVFVALVIRHAKRMRRIILFICGCRKLVQELSFPELGMQDVTLKINSLTPDDDYRGRITPLNSKRCILYIYSTNIGTEYFKHGIYSPCFFFFFKMQFVS